MQASVPVLPRWTGTHSNQGEVALPFCGAVPMSIEDRMIELGMASDYSRREWRRWLRRSRRELRRVIRWSARECAKPNPWA